MITAQIQDSTLGQIIRLNNQINSVTQTLENHINEMTKSEIKEYQQILEEYKQDFIEKKAHVFQNESIFNELLNGMSVSVFFAKYL